MTTEPEFIDEPVPDVTFTIAIVHKDGTAVKVTVESKRAAELASVWSMKGDLREPEVFVLVHSQGVQMFDLSTVQSIAFMTGSSRQTKAMLQRIEEYATSA